MKKSTTDRRTVPVDEPVDSEVIAFRQQFDGSSPLDELVREGAKKMLQAAINAEIDAFVEQYQDRRDEAGRKSPSNAGESPGKRPISTAAICFSPIKNV